VHSRRLPGLDPGLDRDELTHRRPTLFASSWEEVIRVLVVLLHLFVFLHL
jgi:hypothetical protein